MDTEVVGSWLDQLLLRDLPSNRRRSYLCFALAQGLTLASYDFIWPVKVAVFFGIAGADDEPLAKSFVPVVLLPLVVIYNILVSVLSPKVLVLFFCELFSACFLFTAIFLTNSPGQWVAYFLYYSVEIRSVIVMPMIWSVIIDVSTVELSKKAIPCVFFACQVGGIIGSVCAMRVSNLGGEVGLLIMQVVVFQVIIVLVWTGYNLAKQDDDGGLDEEHAPLVPAGSNAAATAAVIEDESADLPRPTSFVGWMYRGCWLSFEGLWLIASRPYVGMLFLCSYAHLMPRTILDYQNSILVTRAMPERNTQVAFFGTINFWISIATALLTLLGTRPIVHRIGVARAMLVLPIVMLGCTLLLCIWYELTVGVLALSISSVLIYGLNSPCKEMLYVPTSSNIRYKSKSWSEMYGNQLQKFIGAQVNMLVNRQTASCAPHCFHRGATFGVVAAWTAVWLSVVIPLGREHTRLTEKGDKVT